MNIHEILAEFDLAYPFDIFPDITQAEREPIIKQYPGFIDRTGAMMGRHLRTLSRKNSRKMVTMTMFPP
jgi:hypothetical protein